MGALFALSLDGRPLETSQHLVVKMVSRAENTGQALEKSPAGAVNAWVLRAPGTGPILTFGLEAMLPTRVWFAGEMEPAHLKTAKEFRSQAEQASPIQACHAASGPANSH